MSKAKGAASPNELVTTLKTLETDSRGRQSAHYTKEAPAIRYAICPACNGAYSLVKWKNFVNKNFEERLKMMRKAQLCHNCFKYGHIALGCLARSTCEVQGCKRRHHILLHPPSPQHTMESRARVADQGTQVDRSTPLQSGQANSTSAGKGKVCLRVVPVKVRRHDANKTVETYALLDSGSDISDKNLAMELGVHGNQKTFFLTTQEKEDKKITREWVMKSA